METHCRCYPCWYTKRRFYDWDPLPVLPDECTCCICTEEARRKKIIEDDARLTFQIYLDAELKAAKKKE